MKVIYPMVLRYSNDTYYFCDDNILSGIASGKRLDGDTEIIFAGESKNKDILMDFLGFKLPKLFPTFEDNESINILRNIKFEDTKINRKFGMVFKKIEYSPDVNVYKLCNKNIILYSTFVKTVPISQFFRKIINEVFEEMFESD